MASVPRKAAEAAKLTPTSTSDDVRKGRSTLEDETLVGIAPLPTFHQGQAGVPGLLHRDRDRGWEVHVARRQAELPHAGAGRHPHAGVELGPEAGRRAGWRSTRRPERNQEDREGET
jgi:hypothetical protein